MSCQVFISHSTRDLAVAEEVLAKLEENEIKCWIAPRDVRIGHKFGREIIQAIRKCPVMVFIFSASSNNSQFVMRELDSAVDEDILIIPFRIEDVQPSDSIKFYIKAAQWLDAFPEPNDEHFEELAKTVKQHLAEKGEGDERVTISTALGETKQTRMSGTKAVRIPAAGDSGDRFSLRGRMDRSQSLLERDQVQGTGRTGKSFARRGLRGFPFTG